MPRDSTLSIALVLPTLLGTYGDRGNAIVLAQRTRWRGMPARIVTVTAERPVPASCDIYVLGGGEDGAQVRATEVLGRGGLRRAVERGAVVLAVCAGLQLLGTRTIDARGRDHPGLGLLDVTTTAGGRRAVGHIVTVADASLGLPDSRLIGFENHAGRTLRGTGVKPLGRLRSGIGNGDGTDGAVCGSIVGTYLHGPVLARNPALADRLLEMATGRAVPAMVVPDVHRMRRATPAAAAPRRR